jgi:hypothetical protein
MRVRHLVHVALMCVMAIDAAAGCGARITPASQAPPTTSQTVDLAPETSTPTTADPSATPTTKPPHTRPPGATRPPTSTRTSTPTPTTAPIHPQLLSLTFSYKGFDLTDVVFTDHNVPPCAHTVWPLKMVITPGNLTFKVVIRVNGVVDTEWNVPPWQPPDPDTVHKPVAVDGPHDVVAEVRLVYTGGSTAKTVHFGCKAP